MAEPVYSERPVWRSLVTSACLLSLLSFDQFALASEAKQLRCWAKWARDGGSFAHIFSIDPDSRSVDRLSGNQGLVYDIDVGSGEISFVASFGTGSFVEYVINRFTLELRVHEMDASLEGTGTVFGGGNQHFVFTKKGDYGFGYCEPTTFGDKKL